MSRLIPFTKMHGAGNDYIYVNTLLYSVPCPEETAVKWSRYHTGIGSDGLVLIGKPTIRSGADFSMRIFNADGSEAMMCGNASRCIGKYLYEKGMTDKREILLETLSGVKTLTLHLAGADAGSRGTVESVTVDMLAPATDVPAQFAPEGQPALPEGTFVSMGNPHYVIFTADIDAVDVAAEGKALEYHPAFPERCNIEFAQVLSDGSIRTRVWERGSGITMACGTGACATAVAAALTGRASRSSRIMMDGGTLSIHWHEADGHVFMTGPAAFVFEGEMGL